MVLLQEWMDLIGILYSLLSILGEGQDLCWLVQIWSVEAEEKESCF